MKKGTIVEVNGKQLVYVGTTPFGGGNFYYNGRLVRSCHFNVIESRWVTDILYEGRTANVWYSVYEK